MADRHVDDLARVQGPLARARARERDDSEPLAAQVDAGRHAQPERMRVLGHGLAADLQAGLVEVHVARVGDGGTQIHVAVAAGLPVLEGPVAERELPVAVDAVHRGDQPFLQAGRGHHDLEDRARRVLALQGPIHQRGLRILHQAEPFLAFEVAGEAVQRKGRARGQREHVAIARVHHHHRARLPGHGLLGHLLDAAIDRRDHLGAGIRLLATHQLHRPAHRVDLDALAPVAPAQVVVEQPLQTRLTDHVAAPVTALLHLLVVDLAHVPQEVGREGAVGIYALGLDFHHHPRQLELPLLDLGDLLERQAAPNPDRTDRVRRHAIERFQQVAHRHLEQHRQAGHHRVAVVHLAGDERECEGRAIVHQGQTVPIEEDAARRGHRSHADAVLFRQLVQAAALQHLQVPELAHQGDEADRGGHREGEHPAAPGLLAVGRCRAQRHARLRRISKVTSARMQSVPMRPL